jgi:hypothetical protein
MLNKQRPRAHARLPDQVTLTHGPHDVLGRFILLADQAARERGVFLSLESDFELLKRINVENMACWYPLAPSFDPHVGGIDAVNGFWILGRNEGREPVLCQIVRFYDWSNTTLATQASNLHVFYPNPALQARPGERCDVSAPGSTRIRGKAVYSGGTWFRPDFRGRGLASIVPRLGRALALSRWNTDYAFSFVQRMLVEKKVPRSYGFRNVEFAVEWKGSAVSDYIEFALVWIEREDFIVDLETTLVLHPGIIRRRS